MNMPRVRPSVIPKYGTFPPCRQSRTGGQRASAGLVAHASVLLLVFLMMVECIGPCCGNNCSQAASEGDLRRKLFTRI